MKLNIIKLNDTFVILEKEFDIFSETMTCHDVEWCGRTVCNDCPFSYSNNPTPRPTKDFNIISLDI